MNSNDSEINIKAQFNWHFRSFKLPLTGLNDYETLVLILRNIFNINDNGLFLIEYRTGKGSKIISSQEDLWNAIDNSLLNNSLSIFITLYNEGNNNVETTNIPSSEIRENSKTTNNSRGVDDHSIPTTSSLSTTTATTTNQSIVSQDTNAFTQFQSYQQSENQNPNNCIKSKQNTNLNQNFIAGTSTSDQYGGNYYDNHDYLTNNYPFYQNLNRGNTDTVQPGDTLFNQFQNKFNEDLNKKTSVTSTTFTSQPQVSTDFSQSFSSYKPFEQGPSPSQNLTENTMSTTTTLLSQSNMNYYYSRSNEPVNNNLYNISMNSNDLNSSKGIMTNDQREISSSNKFNMNTPFSSLQNQPSNGLTSSSMTGGNGLFTTNDLLQNSFQNTSNGFNTGFNTTNESLQGTLTSNVYKTSSTEVQNSVNDPYKQITPTTIALDSLSQQKTDILTPVMSPIQAGQALSANVKSTPLVISTSTTPTSSTLNTMDRSNTIPLSPNNPFKVSTSTSQSSLLNGLPKANSVTSHSTTKSSGMTTTTTSVSTSTSNTPIPESSYMFSSLATATSIKDDTNSLFSDTVTPHSYEEKGKGIANSIMSEKTDYTSSNPYHNDSFIENKTSTIQNSYRMSPKVEDNKDRNEEGVECQKKLDSSTPSQKPTSTSTTGTQTKEMGTQTNFSCIDDMDYIKDIIKRNFNGQATQLQKYMSLLLEEIKKSNFNEDLSKTFDKYLKTKQCDKDHTTEEFVKCVKKGLTTINFEFKEFIYKILKAINDITSTPPSGVIANKSEYTSVPNECTDEKKEGAKGCNQNDEKIVDGINLNEYNIIDEEKIIGGEVKSNDKELGMEKEIKIDKEVAMEEKEKKDRPSKDKGHSENNSINVDQDELVRYAKVALSTINSELKLGLINFLIYLDEKDNNQKKNNKEKKEMNKPLKNQDQVNNEQNSTSNTLNPSVNENQKDNNEKEEKRELQSQEKEVKNNESKNKEEETKNQKDSDSTKKEKDENNEEKKEKDYTSSTKKDNPYKSYSEDVENFYINSFNEYKTKYAEYQKKLKKEASAKRDSFLNGNPFNPCIPPTSFIPPPPPIPPPHFPPFFMNPNPHPNPHPNPNPNPNPHPRPNPNPNPNSKPNLFMKNFINEFRDSLLSSINNSVRFVDDVFTNQPFNENKTENNDKENTTKPSDSSKLEKEEEKKDKKENMEKKEVKQEMEERKVSLKENIDKSTCEDKEFIPSSNISNIEMPSHTNEMDDKKTNISNIEMPSHTNEMDDKKTNIPSQVEKDNYLEADDEKPINPFLDENEIKSEDEEESVKKSDSIQIQNEETSEKEEKETEKNPFLDEDSLEDLAELEKLREEMEFNDNQDPILNAQSINNNDGINALNQTNYNDNMNRNNDDIFSINHLSEQQKNENVYNHEYIMIDHQNQKNQNDYEDLIDLNTENSIKFEEGNKREKGKGKEKVVEEDDDQENYLNINAQVYSNGSSIVDILDEDYSSNFYTAKSSSPEENNDMNPIAITTTTTTTTNSSFSIVDMNTNEFDFLSGNHLDLRNKINSKEESLKKGKEPQPNNADIFKTYEFDLYDDPELEKNIKKRKEEDELLEEYEII